MTASALVLAFHAIEPGPGPLCLTRSQLAAVVATLSKAGYTGLTAGELAERVLSRTAIPERTVVFTFDDGYASVYGNALPVLEDHGYRATVFPVTGHLGGGNQWDRGVRGVPELSLMTADQVSLLVAAGWELGGHTHGHARLTSLSDTAIDDELGRSDAVLSEIAGTAITSFAYPYGAHDERVRALVGARYRICMGIGARRLGSSASLDTASRVEGWYVRNRLQAGLVASTLGGTYLAARGALRLVRAGLERFRTGEGGPS